MLRGRQLANGGTRIQTQAVGLQSQSQPVNEGLPCARPCSRCFIYLIFNHCINARCNGSNDFHFTDEELEALRGRNPTEVKRLKQDLNAGLPKSKAPPTSGPGSSLGAGRNMHDSLSARLCDCGLDLCFCACVSQRHLNSCGPQGLPFAENLPWRRMS